MNYEFHPEAEREFIETAAYYESEVQGLGVRFGAEVNRAIELLLDNPGMGADRRGDTPFRAQAVSAFDCLCRRFRVSAHPCHCPWK